MNAIPRVSLDHRMIYRDTEHQYWLDGIRSKSVTAVAKIAADSFAIDQWEKRQVAIGLATDANLVENVAANLENKEKLDKICAAAKVAARAHSAADRGSQMHRVLELVLTDREHKLITAQQRADAELLKRTLDRYRLRVFNGMAEHFVAWPHYRVTGRFDAILETAGGRLVLTDLKSGPNAVKYPHATSVQLALYARAPIISEAIEVDGDRSVVTQWREMPAGLDYETGYVLLAEPGAQVGEFHEIDLTHGWAAGAKALEIVNWRKQYQRKNETTGYTEWDFIRPLAPPADDAPTPILDRIAAADSLEALRGLWTAAALAGELGDDLRAAALARAAALTP